MDELYVVVLEISAESDGYYVREKINEKVIMDSPVHRYDGFEFRIFVEKKNQKYFWRCNFCDWKQGRKSFGYRGF